MTLQELNKAYAYFFVDSHPDSFGIRNNPGSLAFYETIYHVPENAEPYEEYSENGAVIKRYKYRNSIQFNEAAAYFYWKTIEKDGELTYEIDLA